MTWREPEVFWLLVPYLLLVVYVFLRGGRLKATLGVSFLKVHQMKRGLRAYLSPLPTVFHLGALLLMILALARPQITSTQVQRSVEGIDIFLVLDISDSMLIEDMHPDSRIEAAKTVIKSFVSRLHSDRVGLIVFSGESDMRVPLTWDYPVVLQALSEVKISYYDPYIKKGTAIGVALASAVARLKASQSKSKVILFLTDGEDNVGVINPETALQIVRQHHIRAYTIGVGSYTPLAQIPRKTKDPLGRTRTFYQTLKSQINEPLLKKIASETGGRYYRAHNKQALQGIFSEIAKLEKTPVQVQKWQWHKELFPSFLKAAFLLYALSFVLSLTFFWRTI